MERFPGLLDLPVRHSMDPGRQGAFWYYRARRAAAESAELGHSTDLEVQVPGSRSDLVLAARRNAANNSVQAVVFVAIAVFWLTPMALFWYAVWNDGRPFSMIGCAVGMSISLLAFLLPAGYYHPRPYEQSGRIYEWLGVRWFKRWTPDGDHIVSHIRHFLPDYKVIRGRAGLSSFNVRTRTSEQGHLLWMLVTAPA